MKQKLTTLSGDPVSAASFGAMQFGGTADRAASDGMYAACREAGINFFDTAWVYTDGISERWLGEMVRPERDRIYVASKVAAVGGAGRDNIHQQFEESRQRLGMDVIDALYLHRWDAETPLEETYEALAELHAAGKIRDIGVSNYAAWQVMKAGAVAKDLGLRIALLQPMYNLVKRQAEVELLPMAADQGIAVAPYSPLGGGLLTGKYLNSDQGRLTRDKMYEARYAPGWMHETAGNLVALGNELGIAAPTLAVAWVAANPDIAAPIISARSAEQLKPSLEGLSLEMDAALYERVSALSPAPAPATDRLEEA